MTQELKPIAIDEPSELDDIMTFKCRKEEKEAFYRATGRKGAHYLRQAMGQITRQLTESPTPDNQQELIEKAS